MCFSAGDRILFLDYLTLLKKSKRDADRSRSLWSGTTPVLKCGYHQNCSSYMTHVRTHREGGANIGGVVS